MNEKIKEILDNFKNNYDELGTCYYPEDILGPDDLKPLYNYITTLQQKNEKSNNIINTAISAINTYQNEKTLSLRYEDIKRIRGILKGNDFDIKIFEEYLKELKEENDR